MGIEDKGHWETPTKFVLDEPLQMVGGREMRVIDLGGLLSTSPEITPEDVIEALLAGQATAKPYEGEMIEVECSNCGQDGEMPAEVLRDDPELELALLCPACQRATQN